MYGGMQLFEGLFENSMMVKMLQAQVSNPIINKFKETANNILREFNISLSIKEIKDIKINVLRFIV